MPADNVEIVRRCFDGWNRQDLSLLEELAEPEVEIDLTARVLNPDVYRGYAGFERLIEEVREVWGEFAFEPEEFIDAGNRVVVLVRAHRAGLDGPRRQDHALSLVPRARRGAQGGRPARARRLATPDRSARPG